jgi:predicted membrane protein
VGVKVRSHCFVASVNIFGEESSGIMAPADGQTKNYDLATKKVILDVSYFVCDVKVVQA